jgi:hypothetical protein
MKYVGTRRYHNFTTGKTYNDPESKRHMQSFEASEPFIDDVNGGEWVVLSVLGQSFLLNQIRKMVTLAVEVARGNAGLAVFEEAFSAKQMDITMSPGLGLYLDELFFDGYNIKQRQQEAFEKKAAKKAAASSATTDKSKASLPQLPLPPPPSSSSSASSTVENVTVAVAGDDTKLNGDREKCGDDGDGDGDNPEASRKKARLQSDEDNKLVQPQVDLQSIEQAPKQQTTQGGGGEDADDSLEKEVIEWSIEPSTKAILDKFALGTIRPHVYMQEETSLQFLYFLDYLRAYPPNYSVTAKPKQITVQPLASESEVAPL